MCRRTLVQLQESTGAEVLFTVFGTAYAVEGLPDENGKNLLAGLKSRALQDR